MNRIYRSIWNQKSGTFVAVSENAKSSGKKSSPGTSTVARVTHFALKGLALSLMLAFGSNIYALPTGGVVSAGSASIASGTGTTTISQASQNTAINWQGFSIGRTEAVRFVQPNSSSIALNRVLGSDPSNILGSLSANGKVFLTNPNGILFGQGAQVNVGGLVASTLGISDSDFMAGKYNFAGASNAAILNQGTINADGGYVALLGANVSNEGVISAQLGTVALAAGNAVTLDVAGDGLLNVAVNQGAMNALAQNGGLIQADGGQVLLTALSAGNLLQSAVNNTGVIQAQTIENHNGTIRLMGDMQSGTVNVGGKLDASAPNGGDGGFIETSAAHVNVQDNARVTTAAPKGLTGTWLIDPVDFTVGSAPGDNITGAALSASLVDSDINITTVAGPGVGNGDININEAVTWNGSLGASLVPTTLTLNALRNVNIDAAITPTKGNLVACCGQDINVREAITSVNGSVLLSAGQDVNIVRSLANPATVITTTDGNIKICAGRNVNLNNTFNGAALMTLTTGSIVDGENLSTLGVTRGLTLSAGTASTGPGAAGGTVIIGAGTIITVTGPAGISPINISYNPATYLAPTDYSGFFATGNGAPYAQFMLVFPDGANKIYDGTRAATFTGLKSSPAGVTLAGAGTGTFDTKDVGTDKTITFSGFTLAQGATETGGTGINFALPVSCCAPLDGRTSANITQALLTLQANNNTKVYGQTFTPLSTAFTVPVPPVPGETVTNVTETSTGTGPAVSVAGSTYPIVITPGSATGTGGFLTTNYNITYLDGALDVTAALVTLQADNATKVYGQTFTPLSTAFTIPVPPQNGETVTGVTETSTGSATTASVAGSTYPIVITPGSATGSITASNYIITYLDGALTVNPTPLTVTANDATKVYGQTFTPASTAFTTTALQNGETVASVTEVSPAGTPATAAVPGPYAITPSAAAANGAFLPTNYTISYVDGALTVTAAPLTVTALPVTKVFGETPTLSLFTTTGLVNSETVGSVTETSPGTL
ncbi:MAG: two-partner secretion domain-containing protein, partial [Burkholderiales bacterium]